MDIVCIGLFVGLVVGVELLGKLGVGVGVLVFVDVIEDVGEFGGVGV